MARSGFNAGAGRAKVALWAVVLACGATHAASAPVSPQQQAVLMHAVRQGASVTAAAALCNGRDPAAVKAKARAAMRTRARADGMPAKVFDREFDAAFAATLRQYKAVTPAQRKAGCDRLRTLATQAKPPAGKSPKR